MKIVIPGNPIPKARARFFIRNGHIASYDPQEKEKNAVTLFFVQALKEALNSSANEILENAQKLISSNIFHMSVHMYMPITNSSKKGQKNAKLWHLEPCNHKPDCTNVYKFYEDAANSVLYHDDCQIVSGDFFKQYSDNPRTEIIIMSKKELNLNPLVSNILKEISPAQVKELIDDARILEVIYKKATDKNSEDDREKWLGATACILNELSQKFTNILKKIQKYDGIREEIHFDKTKYLEEIKNAQRSNIQYPT